MYIDIEPGFDLFADEVSAGYRVSINAQHIAPLLIGLDEKDIHGYFFSWVAKFFVLAMLLVDGLGVTPLSEFDTRGILAMRLTNRHLKHLTQLPPLPRATTLFVPPCQGGRKRTFC